MDSGRFAFLKSMQEKLPREIWLGEVRTAVDRGELTPVEVLELFIREY